MYRIRQAIDLSFVSTIGRHEGGVGTQVGYILSCNYVNASMQNILPSYLQSHSRQPSPLRTSPNKSKNMSSENNSSTILFRMGVTGGRWVLVSGFGVIMLLSMLAINP